MESCRVLFATGGELRPATLALKREVGAREDAVADLRVPFLAAENHVPHDCRAFRDTACVPAAWRSCGFFPCNCTQTSRRRLSIMHGTPSCRHPDGRLQAEQPIPIRYRSGLLALPALSEHRGHRISPARSPRTRHTVRVGVSSSRARVTARCKASSASCSKSSRAAMLPPVL